MKFNRDDKRSGGFKSYGKKSFGGDDRGFGGRSGGKAFMHDATCSTCGKPCQIPFKPSPGRPVFCSNCFSKNDDRGGEHQARPLISNYERPRFAPAAQNNGSTNPIEQLKGHFAQLNSKLDAILRVLTTSEGIEDSDDEDEGEDESEEEVVAVKEVAPKLKTKKALGKKK